ncbi:MAG: flippase-like domain-containing protein [Chitinophagaceae bacterium]|nr:flippase-like domain-containing protein [Chitinophagaceae bacterium]
MRKRIRILLNYVVGPALFIWFSWSIYYKIQEQRDVQQSWQEIVKAVNSSNFWNLSFVVILMLANWGIEARKWQIQTANMEKLSFLAACKAIFAGQAMGFSTFNRIGEPAGRAIFLREGNRLRGVVLSFVGSMAQIITTFVMGAICLLYLRLNMLDSTHQIPGLSIFWLDSLIYIITVGVSLFSLAYFRMPGLIELLERIPIVTKYRFFVERLEVFSYSQLFRILGYSFLRFFVFLLQYYLMSSVFDISIFWLDVFALVGVLLLVLAIVPTITLAELGLRGQVSLILFGLFTSNSLGIIAMAASIWLINLLLPAILGTIFVLGVRIFKNKSTVE